MTSDVTGITSSFEFTVNTSAPEVSLVGCDDGETTINDVTVSGYKVGDRIRVYRATKMGEELVEEVEILSLATKVPTIDEGGEYRIVVESEAGVQTELHFVRKHKTSLCQRHNFTSALPMLRSNPCPSAAFML